MFPFAPQRSVNGVIKLMEKIMKNLIGLFALLSINSFAHANDSFVVNAKIYENKNLISSPTLVVNSDEKASIIIDDLYHLALTLTPIDDSTASLQTELDIGGKHMSPSLVVELGKEASIRIDGNEFSVIVNKSSS